MERDGCFAGGEDVLSCDGGEGCDSIVDVFEVNHEKKDTRIAPRAPG
jgi:hypothetical protein